MEIPVPNVLNNETLGELIRSLQQASGPILLTGTSDCFCRGMDLAALDEGEHAMALFARCLLAIRTGPTAVAFVSGEARGGGVGLAAACDLVLADGSAEFALPEALFGLTPAAIWPVLRERVSSPRLRWMACRGGAISAESAEKIGLVDQIIDSADLRAWLRGLDRAEPNAVRALKELDADLGDRIRAGAAKTSARLRSPEVTERIRVFRAGGAPWMV